MKRFKIMGVNLQKMNKQLHGELLYLWRNQPSDNQPQLPDPQ